MKHYLYLFLPLLFFSCSFFTQEDKPDISDIEVKFEIKKLHEEIYTLQTRDDILDFISQDSLLARCLFQIEEKNQARGLVRRIKRFTKFEPNHVLKTEVDSVFGDLSELKNELKKAFQYIKYYFPDFKVPQVYTAITAFGSYGFGTDLIVDDEVIIIGLDYFLGEGATYRPVDLPKYIRKRYTPDYLLASIVQLLSKKYIKSSKDNTILNDMIFYGKSYYFCSKVLPNAPDSIIAGYDAKETQIATHYQKEIWSHFIEKGLFYKTNYFVRTKYVQERPQTFEISSVCPGRIGRWLGWLLVKSYAERYAEMDMKNLLEKDAKEILQNCAYKPLK